MRITDISISNFRGITHLEMCNLAQTVVIAGGNGSGKSTIFDAIRLWKSAQGGYRKDEYVSWLQEFGLSQNNSKLSSMRQRPDRDIVIALTFQLEESERAWIDANAEDLLAEIALRNKYDDMRYPAFMQMSEISDQYRARRAEIQTQVQQEARLLRDDLRSADFGGVVSINLDDRIVTHTSIVAQKAFSFYYPDHLGVIEHYGPQRTFARESLGGIHVSFQDSSDTRSQNALYNQGSKYSNIKSELAASYLRRMIVEKALPDVPAPSSGLDETLIEMFNRFFPGKSFEGVRPTAKGSLSFDVVTAAGSHDIDELSSGEKELIYGYLRLKSYSPKNSIILLDEPELHLNPRLVDGLPDFYQRNIGSALNNQLWLVTHSDTILRQSVGRVGFSVFHMQTAGMQASEGNQIIEVQDKDALERALIDLVGDLAAYSPGATTVILEGGGDTEFDARLIRDLFPEIATKVNIISAGSKRQVRQLHQALDSLRGQDGFPSRIVSIVDQDDETGSQSALRENALSWDRYHIENYLIEATFIKAALHSIGHDLRHKDDQEIEERLKEAAVTTLDRLVQHAVESFVRNKIQPLMRINSRREGGYSPAETADLVCLAVESLRETSASDLSKQKLSDLALQTRSELERSLTSDAWKSKFRGRDVLKSFVGNELNGIVRYEVFRNIVISRMQDAGFQPSGMKQVLEQIR